MKPTAGILVILTTLVASCAETRVVEERGFQTLRDLQPGGLRPVRADQRTAPAGGGFEAVLTKQDLPGTPDPDDPLRRTMPDRSVRLYAFSPRQLIHHMLITLANNEGELIDRCIVSDALKEAYRAEGRDPGDITRSMLRNAPHIIRLLKLVPLGEATPGAAFEVIGRNRFRLAPLGSEMLDLRYTSLQFTIEEGEFRLLMIE